MKPDSARNFSSPTVSVTMREKPVGRTVLDEDAVCGALDGDDVGQSDETGLGGRVVRLHRLAEIARRRRDEDEAAVLLLRHHPECRLAQIEPAVEVHAQHLPPVVERELVERDAVEDARIADDDVQTAESVHRGVDDGLAALGGVHRVVGGDRSAACLADLGDDLVGDARVGALATHRAAEVVDHHGRAAPREVEGVQPAESATRSRHDRDLPGEVDHDAVPAISRPTALLVRCPGCPSSLLKLSNRLR